MRVVFMGSSPFGCPTLTALIDDPSVEVVGVVSQPDRPKGRNLSSCACAAKQLAAEKGVGILTPENVNADESIAAIQNLAPDYFVVVAYGQILKPVLLNSWPDHFINLHASLLPAYRGAAPIQWAVANGDGVTGVSTMYMDEGMDTGDVIFQRFLEVGERETAGELHDRLASLGAELCLESLRAIESGTAPRTPQDDAKATYAPKLEKLDGRIDWTANAEEIYNRVRGFNPWPVCTCDRAGELIRVWEVRIVDCQGVPGQVLDVCGEGPVVATGSKAVCLLVVQPPGRPLMDGRSYLNGKPMKVGEQLA